MSSHIENCNNLSDKIVCLCGGHYSYRNYWIHIKTKKHLLFIESGVPYIKKCNFEDIENRREYQRKYYEIHPEVWLNTPSQLAKRKKVNQHVEIMI